jgi:nucleoside triphosphate diphosphatase
LRERSGFGFEAGHLTRYRPVTMTEPHQSAPFPVDELPTEPFERLIAVMAALRDPERGCPWDIAQSFETIAPYTIEEAYEVAEAITNGNKAELKDELGDLLFQVVYHARMAQEDGDFDVRDVATAIAEKMLRRHPHVFGTASVEDADAQTRAWEDSKASERIAKAEAEGRVPSVLDGVSAAYPALMRAVKIQKRVVRVGFDWPNSTDVLDKLDEELGELKHELATGSVPDRVEDEMGDLLFTVVNLARHLGVDPETALRRTNGKFERRFRAVEAALAETGRTPEDSSLDEMGQIWIATKLKEHANT